MTANPLKIVETPRVRMTAQDWAARGNRILAGTEPTTKGEYLPPRHDVRWVVRDGRCVIEWAR